MGKYEPLGDFLRGVYGDEVPMSFEEIEATIGRPLPPRAPSNRAWWSNNPSNNVMTQVWLDAGFRSEQVDIPGRRLVFRRTTAAPPAARQGVEEGPGLLERLWSRLGGTVTIPEGVDITEPTGEVWDAEVQ